MTYSQKQNAYRVYRRLLKGETGYIKDPSKYKDYLTTEEYEDLLKMNQKKRRELDLKGYRKDKGQIRPQSRAGGKQYYHKTYNRENIVNLLKRNPDGKIVDSTREKDSRNIVGIFNLFNTDNMAEIIETNTAEQILDKLKSKYKGGLISVLQSFMKLIEDLSPQLAKKFGKDNIDYMRKALNRLKEEKTQKNFEDREADTNDYTKMFEELTNKEEDYAKKTPYTQEHLILALYSKNIIDSEGKIALIPRSYFAKVRVLHTRDAEHHQIGDFEDGNSYNPNTKRLKITQFKTGKRFSYDFVVNTYMANLIKKSLEKEPRDYLLTGADKTKPINEKTLLKKINKLTGYGINNLRRILENSVLKTNKFNKVDVATAAGHSVAIAEQNYRQKRMD